MNALETIGTTDAADAVLSVATAVKKIDPHMQLLITLGGALWQKMTETKPYSKEDKKQYDQLIHLYTTCQGSAETPAGWKLDANNHPEYCATFEILTGALNEHLTTLKSCHFKLKKQAIAIVNIISTLFESINKRNGFISFCKDKILGAGEYRSDGFEQMFFNELALWVSTKLPLLSPNDLSSAEEVKKRIDYCKAVYNQVLIFRSDADKPNPKNQLAIIIKQLNGVYLDILKCAQAITFNQTIDKIADELSEIIGNTFEICHLVSECAYPKHLIVTEYLNPTLENRDKSQIHLESLMAKWMIQTFTLAGVENNNFSNTKKIDLTQISQYLRSDLPLDSSQINLQENKSGLPKFARKNPDQAKLHLERIAEMHRAILNLYHVRESLVIAAQVVANYGEVWLYGNNEGKLVLKALLTVINDVCCKHLKSVKLFWENFYGIDPTAPKQESYLAYVKQKKGDSREPHHDYLQAADSFYQSILKLNSSIAAKITSILAASDKFEQDQGSARQQKKDLIIHLHTYMQSMQGIDDAQLDAIGGLLEEIQRPLTTTQTTEPTTTQTTTFTTTQNTSLTTGPMYSAPHPEPIILAPAQLQLFLKAQEFYKFFVLEPNLTTERPIQNLPADYSLMQRPRKFYSQIQSDIYEGFLLPFNKPVNAWRILIKLRFGITSTIMGSLQQAYSGVNKIMAEIYTGSFRETMQMAEEVQMHLVDEYLRMTMNEINHLFNPRNRHIKITDKPLKYFHVIKEENGNNFVVTLNEAYTKIAKDGYKQLIEREVQERTKKINAELERALKERAEKDSQCEGAEQVNQDLQKTRANQRSPADFAALEAELKREKQVSQDLIAKFANQPSPADFAALQEELKGANQVIQDLQKTLANQPSLTDFTKLKAELERANQVNQNLREKLEKQPSAADGATSKKDVKQLKTVAVDAAPRTTTQQARSTTASMEPPRTSTEKPKEKKSSFGIFGSKKKNTQQTSSSTEANPSCL